MNIAIIGIGLIGGSLGRALVKKTHHRVFAFDINEDVMLQGQLLNAYHDKLTDENIKDIDILFLGVYSRTTVAVLGSYVQKLKKGAIVIDSAGNKRGIFLEMCALKDKYPDVEFIASHPMAGREFSGISHATATLFEKASVIVMPVHNKIETLTLVKELFLSIGCDGIILSTPDEHDAMIAYTSQLAHIVSSAYIKNPKAKDHYGFSAGSFRDMTRVAKLNPKMWSELMVDNSDNLSCEIDVLLNNLNAFKNALIKKDEAKLQQLLSEGNSAKEEVESSKQRKLSEKFS